MSSRDQGSRLYGRGAECEVLDGVIAAVRAGESRILVLHGEAGIGKTALLDYLAEHADGCRVVRVSGAESEAELAFAALHQLCAPMLEGLGRLPAPQREALATSFGLSTGAAPDRFLVGLAVLSLLSDAAADDPLVCLVDDAQWLDRISAQTLAFVARRLMAERVALVFAVRDVDGSPELAGLPELVVEGLRDNDARGLFDAAVSGRLDERVRDRIVAETRGNPLALLELPRGFTPAELAGGFGLLDAQALPGRIEESFRRQFAPLDDETRLLLLLAAAEPVGDPVLVWAAAEQLGVQAAARAAAGASGLVDFGARVRFRHPLLRSAIYRAASPAERSRMHRALADVTDPVIDPDRRAWHMSRATTGLDESVAGELERSADRAQARGGLAASAAFLDRAVQLTPDPARRGARALLAAQAQFKAGAFNAALALANVAELSPLDEFGAARLTLLRGRIAFASTSASAGLPLLLEAAKRLEPLDARLARETYRDAIYAALTAGRLPSGGLPDVAQAVLTAPKAEPMRDVLLLDGLAQVTTKGYAVGAPTLLQALLAFRADDVSAEGDLGWLTLAGRMAHDAWDFESWSALSARLVGLARETGALSMLPSALLLRLSNRAFAGDLTGAETLLSEAVAIGEATGSGFFAHYGALVLEAWRGREMAVHQAIEAITHDLLLRGEGKVFTATQWAAAVLYNGVGRYEEAYVAAKRGCENPEELGLSTQSMVELVEAAARLGRQRDAAEAVQTLSEMARATGTDWALGIASHAQALVSTGPEAEDCYRTAVERLGHTEVRMQLARVLLCYGEWLRRENRRLDARAQLGMAHEMLSQFGAEAFAERARRELQATGATIRKRDPAAHQGLSPQEAQIARLAGEGLTNQEIGAQLFISSHTVEWHLRKVFAKLGIRSRRQLRTTLTQGAMA